MVSPGIPGRSARGGQPGSSAAARPKKMEGQHPSILNLYRTRGLAASPLSCRIIAGRGRIRRERGTAGNFRRAEPATRPGQRPRQAERRRSRRPRSPGRPRCLPRHVCPPPEIGADDLNYPTASAFDLPDHLAAKADPTLIAGDEEHFAAIAESLAETIAELSGRLDVELSGAGRYRPGGDGPGPGGAPAEPHGCAPCAGSAWTCASAASSARTSPSRSTSGGSG